ncbi:LacI family DNA-binding transcriptional regulator [Microbacterium sp. NPDC056569]|uniref:LacI family DNA-binding transcriptional regulator n=1 Tax=Microbacterium sp. NPDC056569 TaxID=3345867 RepID=UPI00366FE095
MATMRQVAERAGVSISTVSFIVNNTKPVSEETRARVESAMDELGFRRNVLARALATQRTRIIAIAFPSEQHRLGPTALSIITAAAATAADRGHSVVLWPVGYEDGRLDEYARSGLVDGVLLMEVRADDPRIAVLERLGIPFGLIGRTRTDEELSFVDLDFEMAVRDGVEHLRSLGHREIALVVGEIAGPDYGGYGPVMRTTEAFRNRMTELGLPAVIVESPHTPLGGVMAAESLVNEHPEVTGTLVLNEAALFGFLSGVTRTGYRVPEDLSIVGLATSADNVAIADPVLSTIVAPGSEVGVTAVNGMIDVLEGTSTEPTRALVRCILQPAGSTTAPPSSRPL